MRSTRFSAYDHWRMTDPREADEEREAQRLSQEAWEEDHAEEIDEARTEEWLWRNEP